MHRSVSALCGTLEGCEPSVSQFARWLVCHGSIGEETIIVRKPVCDSCEHKMLTVYMSDIFCVCTIWTYSSFSAKTVLMQDNFHACQVLCKIVFIAIIGSLPTRRNESVRRQFGCETGRLADTRLHAGRKRDLFS